MRDSRPCSRGGCGTLVRKVGGGVGGGAMSAEVEREASSGNGG
jgi:hypothetical protein